ncbi:MAG TPA: hypothetical protein VLZ29_04170 [Sulfurimonas sp.]|uniref:c-type cytochrome n=1 Tax=Sulfurimonas sp. TaxID=2022749 RepID=UPI002C0405A8|nr:cytochrome c [Sulfurimonas sp.]HUH42290.1 hypothetical protein [Sulfurimonas sp.]
MRDMLLLLLPLSLFAQSSFITPMEYSSSLYKNPRGIGCHKCHGEYGEGKIVARYEHKKEQKTFFGPGITGMDFNDFYNALNVRKNGMPRYFLTQNEIKALYFYLQEKKKNGTSNDK